MGPDRFALAAGSTEATNEALLNAQQDIAYAQCVAEDGRANMPRIRTVMTASTKTS